MKKQQETPEKVLTEIEVKDLEKTHLLSDLRKAEDEIIKLRKIVLEQRKSLLQMALRDCGLDNKAILDDEKSLEKKKNDDKKARDTVLENIKTRLGLKSASFGYDPITCAVIE
jgi:hypothetical protein